MENIAFKVEYFNKIFKLIPNKNTMVYFSFTDNDKNIRGVVIKLEKKLYLNFWDINKKELIQKSKFIKQNENYVFLNKVEYMPSYTSLDNIKDIIAFLEEDYFVQTNIYAKELNVLMYIDFLEKNQVEMASQI